MAGRVAEQPVADVARVGRLVGVLVELELHEHEQLVEAPAVAKAWARGVTHVVQRRVVTDDRDDPSLYSPAARRELGL
jgi:hypothetical protein